MNRIELIETIGASRYRLMQAVEQFSDSDCVAGLLENNWSVKDVLAHIAWWEQRATRLYHAAAGTGPAVEPIRAEQINEVNEQTYADHRAVALETVRDMEQAAFQELLTIVETIPEEDLFDENRFQRFGGNPYLHIVIANTYDHYDEHAAMLEGYLAGKADGGGDA